MEGGGETLRKLGEIVAKPLVLGWVQFLATLLIVCWQYDLNKKLNRINAELGHATFKANEVWKRRLELENQLMFLLTDADETISELLDEIERMIVASNSMDRNAHLELARDAIRNFDKLISEYIRFRGNYYAILDLDEQVGTAATELLTIAAEPSMNLMLELLEQIRTGQLNAETKEEISQHIESTRTVLANARSELLQHIRETRGG